MYTTDMYEGMIAETITIQAHGGDVINAYVARPLGPGPYPGMVLAHHMPGWDEWYREATRKFAHHGYVTICRTCTTERDTERRMIVAARVRSEGGIADDQAVGRPGGGDGLRQVAAELERQGRRVRNLLGRAPRPSGGVAGGRV